MNNFNFVLDIIKQNCTVPGVPSSTCMSQIMLELDNVYHEHIDFYLGFLNDLGLIEYDKQHQLITLTEIGLGTTALFE